MTLRKSLRRRRKIYAKGIPLGEGLQKQNKWKNKETELVVVRQL